MSDTVVPPERIEAKRREREKQRLEREALDGSILGPLDDDDDQPCTPASSAERKEPHR